MPGRGQRPGLGLAVADDARDDQFRIVEGGAERMAERVAELAAFVQRTGTLRRGMAGNAARERELAEQRAHAVLVLGDLGIGLRPGPLQPGVGDHGRPAMAGAADVDHVHVLAADDAVEVGVDEVLARRRSPVAEDHALDVGGHQRTLQQRVVAQVHLPDGQVVGGTPIGVDAAQLLRRQRLFQQAHLRFLDDSRGCESGSMGQASTDDDAAPMPGLNSPSPCRARAAPEPARSEEPARHRCREACDRRRGGRASR